MFVEMFVTDARRLLNANYVVLTHTRTYTRSRSHVLFGGDFFGMNHILRDAAKC